MWRERKQATTDREQVASFNQNNNNDFTVGPRGSGPYLRFVTSIISTFHDDKTVSQRRSSSSSKKVKTTRGKSKGEQGSIPREEEALRVKKGIKE